jgi:hypothetical protein
VLKVSENFETKYFVLIVFSCKGCGECYSVTGPNGNAVFIVNEVGDIGAIGISGQGVHPDYVFDFDLIVFS